MKGKLFVSIAMLFASLPECSAFGREQPSIKARHDLHLTASASENSNTRIGLRAMNEIGADVMTHGLMYITWLYAAAFAAYSLRMYCVACDATVIKNGIPAMYVIQLLWKVSDSKATTEGHKGTLEALTYYGLCGLNIFGAALVFSDMLRCFLKQVRPVVSA